MSRPLEGFRVIDCTHVLAGPYCGYQLGMLGAEVIRIDRVDTGDFIRHRGAERKLNDVGMAASFMVQNAGKKSLAINLKDPRGQAILKDLVKSADVMCENFRPGKLTALGLGFDEMAKIKEDLIYCSLTGFGQSGILRDFPAYDYLVQGVSGYMSVNATPAGDPQRIAFPIIDYLTGLVGAFAVTTALLQRERTGKGQNIDVSMLEAALIMLGPLIGPMLISGVQPVNTGNRPASGSAFSGVYDTKDGRLVVVANTPGQATALAKAIDRPDLLSDPGLQQHPPTEDAIITVKKILAECFTARSADEWEEHLNACSVPAGRLKDLQEVLQHNHLLERGFLHRINNVPGINRDIDVPGIGFHMPGINTAPIGPPPLQGAQSRDLLSELGYSADDIDGLITDNVVKAS